MAISGGRLEGARIYDLSHVLEPDMPQSADHRPFRTVLTKRHGDVVRSDGGSAASDMVIMGTHSGTHIDALCHVSQGGRLFDGIDAHQAQQHGSFSRLGIETVPPILCRGVLLDVASYVGVPTLAAGYIVTADDLKRTADAQVTEIRRGDAVCIRTGWSVYWNEPQAYLGVASGVPGPDADAAHWLCSQQVRLVGSDTFAFEVIPASGLRTLPAHRVLLVEHGVYICENMHLETIATDKVYDFTFFAAPLKLRGATGSPVRPVALKEP